MKADLIIGDGEPRPVDVVSPPRPGDLVLDGEQRLRIREVGHDIVKKKLRIWCHVPPEKSPESDLIAPAATYQPDYEEEDTDMEVQ